MSVLPKVEARTAGVGFAVWLRALALAILTAPPVLSSEVIQLGTYPSQTAIANVPFESPPAQVLDGSVVTSWSLLDSPPGMLINPTSGRITWAAPAFANDSPYAITIVANTPNGPGYVEWILRVVENNFPDPVIVSTRYMDFVVPRDIAGWTAQWGAKAYVDGYWERLRDLLGQEPLDGKQVMKYEPSLGGGAHSGHPAKAGPGWWTLDPVQGWTLGAWHHEVGHNFHGETWIGRVIKGGSWPDGYFHHGMELSQVSVQARILENPAAFGLSGEALTNFRAWSASLDVDFDNRAQPYFAWLQSDGRAENYQGDQYGVFGWICRDLQQRYGLTVLENTLRAVRVDGLPGSLYDLADTDLRRNTLFFSILSCAAGDDLRGYFSGLGFDTDDAFFTEANAAVCDEMSRLPHEDARGWKRSPLNAHLYRLTPWSTSWHEAERMAQRLGGHLVTVRSEAEDAWLRNRFANKRPAWIGLSDELQDGNWVWSSSEPFGYQHWGPNEPNGGTSEYFATLDWYDFDGWVDVNDSPRYYGIIEVPPAKAEVAAGRSTIAGGGGRSAGGGLVLRGTIAQWDAGESSGTVGIHKLALKGGFWFALIAGDCGGNSGVSVGDVPHFTACLTGPSAPADGACWCGDFDGDSDVDLRDFAEFQDEYVAPRAIAS